VRKTNILIFLNFYIRYYCKTILAYYFLDVHLCLILVTIEKNGIRFELKSYCLDKKLVYIYTYILTLIIGSREFISFDDQLRSLGSENLD
jgi:hypothetical protein